MITRQPLFLKYEVPMKKIISILAIMLLFLLPQFAMAAGTVTITDKKVTSDVTEVTFTWVADASAHTVPDTTTTNEYNGYIIMAVINPDDSVAPTASYDVDIDNADGADTFGAGLEDLSATLGEIRLPKPDGTNFRDCFVTGKLTFQLSGNLIDSAAGVVKVYIDRAR